MSVDIANLGIRVDSTQAKNAAGDLDQLAAAGAAAETQTESLSRAAMALNAAHQQVAASSLRTQRAMNQVAAGSKLAAHEALNLGRQFADIGVTAAMGMNPLMILVQQGPQIADIMKTSGIGVHDIFREFGLLLGIVRVSQGVIDESTGKTAALAAAEAVLARETLAVTEAQAALTISTNRVTAARALAAAEARALAAANVVVEETAIAAAAAETVALAPVGVVLAAIAAAVAAVGIGFALWANEANKSTGDLTKTMGLTENQLERLKTKGTDTAVTMTDMFVGFFQAISSRFKDAFGPQIDWVTKKFHEAYDFIVDASVWTVKTIVGTFYAGYYIITDTWALLPGAFKDIMVQVENIVGESFTNMANNGIKEINSMVRIRHGNGPAKNLLNIPEISPWVPIKNENEGAASRAADAARAAGKKGMKKGSDVVDSIADDTLSNARRRAEGRIREDAGKPGAERKGPKTEGEKAGDEAKRYLTSLQTEIDKIGKNKIEEKMSEIEVAASKAAKFGFGDLAAKIRESGQAWKEATISQALKDLKRDLTDQADAEKFEAETLKMNAKEREIATAARAIHLRMVALERDGIHLTADQIKEETDAILRNAEARGQVKLDVDNAKEYTSAMRDLTDTMRDAVDGFGELFGTAGEGFENLINVIADYADRRAELEERINDMSDTSAKGDEERARASDELARATVANYGNMLHASKSFFREGSTGYRVLEAAERAYRLYQLVSTAIHIASKAKSIAADTAHTASSVANSGARATADGIAAVAKAIASLPFPLNLVAGAATIAALVAVGVKIAGKGGGGGASAASSSTKEDTGPGYSSGMSSPYSTLPGAGGLYDPKNAGKDGTPTPASANDNSFASNNTARGSTSSSFTYAPTIHAPNADAGTVQQIQDLLESNKQEAVELARAAAAEDRFNEASRQRIGNGY